jgi:CheY-like chemotaxis protein
MAVVTVADSGRGIAPEMLANIFELFWQERQEMDRSRGGLGLGLAIVRSLVQAHGGTVTAQSEGKGRGAAFTVRLPLAQASGQRTVEPAPLAAASPDDATAATRILVVDDNRDAAEMMAESLRTLGYTTCVALDGPAALEAADTFQPDIALLDLGLPVMDGFEVGRRLKEKFARIELVAVTGYGQRSDRRKTREAGFAEHLTKPVDLSHLDAWLRRQAD